MEHQQVSSVSAAAPFSKKFSYDRGHGGKHVYDGVFSGGGGAVKLGARVLDYREIFGGTAATASSIPILDVPQLNENSKVSSFGAQRADYAKIFGGFEDDDFGLLHEELFAKRKKVKSSINGTRSLAEARSRNAGSKHSNVSKEQRDSSPEAPFQSIDGVKLLNVSYNKSNPGNKNGTNEMTRVAQLHAVPGYTFLVDEITPSKMTEGGKPARSVLNDSHLNANVGKSVKEDTARRKAVSGPQPRIDDRNSFRSSAEFQKKSSRNRSISNDMPFDAFEIGLGRRPPSCSPTNSSYNIGGTDISKNSKFGVSRNDASRGADLPASSDEEMDANSDAAASAAALRKAIEEAQMKIKIAKELMERKNEGFQNHAKAGFNKSWKAQKSKVKPEERLKRSNELVDREMREKEDTAKQEFTGVSEGNVSKASQLTPDFGDEKKSSFANNAAGETHSKESKSTRTDNRLEAEDWESTEEFFEAADHEELREMPSEFDQSENAEKMASYNHENKWSEKMTAEEKIKKPEECTEEVFNEDKVERELNSVVGAFQWNLYANFVKPSQVCHREENENKTRISNNHEETYQTPTVSDEWKDCETVLENLHQPEENVKLPVQELDENEDMKELKDAQDWVETEKKQREALDHKETDNRSDEVSIREENDRDLDQIYEKKQNVEGQQEERDRVECEMKQGGWNLEEYAEKLNDLHRVEISGDDDETEESEKPEKLVDDEEILKKSDQMNEPEESTKLPVHELEENEDMKELKDWVETKKQRREALDHKETENRSNEVPIREENDRGLNQIHENEENVEGQQEEWDRVECEMKRGWNLEEYEEKLNDLHRGEISGEDGETEKSEKLEKLVDDEEILKKSDQMNGPEENAELPVQELEENEDMKGLKDAQDWVETEKKQREALDHKETDNRSDEVSIREENDRDLDQIYEKKQNVEGQQEERDRVECEMKQGGWNLEEYAEKLNDLHRVEISGDDDETEESEKPEKLVDDEEILKKSDQMNEPEESTKLPVHELEENEDMKELKDWVETKKQRREALDHKETENRSNEVPIREENDRGLNQIHENEENVEGQQEEWDRVECEMKRGWNLEEYEEKLNDLHRGEISGEDGETEKSEKLEKLVDDEEILKKSDQMNGPEENAELPVQELEENEDMKGLKDAQDWVETEKKQREALDHREMENRSDEVPIGEESDGGLNQIYEKKENMEGQRKEWDRVECERKQGGWNLEENEKLNDLHRIEILGEEGKTEESEKPEELMDDEEILKKSDQMNETENREEKAREGIETERIRSKSCPGEQDEKTMEVTEQALRYEGGNLEMAEDANEQYENENLGGSDNALGCKINFAVGDLKAEVLTTKENGRVMGVTESSPLLQGTEKESEAVEDANNLEQQNCEIAGLTHGFIGLDRIKKQTADVTEALLNGENGIYLGENDINFEDKQNEHHVTEYKNMSNQEKFFEEVTNEMDANGNVDICEPEVGTDNEESEKSSISSHNERWSSDETESLHDPVCCVEEAAHELGENNNDVKESEVATNHEKDKNSCESSDEDRWVGNDVDTEASQQPIFEGQGKTTEISLEEEPNQSTSKKEENHCKNPAIKEKEAEDNLQRKLEVEKKHFSKKEEVKVREIEREKERIAVERAIQEARERAFAEARERAAVKRAAAEAHQRLKAEVRERLGKALLEANNKLAAEKASFEAKLKAERAAVERATAEARQRALEKALSEKVRNQAEKSAAERFSSISKDNGMNSRDKQCNDPGPSSSSRYPGSSNHGERFNGGNGESAPRNKATLERHQRTAERAAKALAEKNMRELLAQKEQAERNRLAETLEADVKRWSSGKERNLRALLSTLPYILGPDSGWQPIPLTELVSSTAVKKAYRKATLFVHPDKLQQRGASIQLKYTCEKVFDLLKDAWNKFSAEER